MFQRVLRVMLCAALSAPVSATLAQVPAPSQPAVRTVTLTPRAISAAGVRVDLSRAGTVYAIDSTVDPTRVTVSGGKRAYSLAELNALFGRRGRGATRLANPADFAAQRRQTARSGVRAHPTQFACTDVSCACTDDVDCDDMFRGTRCGPIAQCDAAGCWCLRP